MTEKTMLLMSAFCQTLLTSHLALLAQVRGISQDEAAKAFRQELLGSLRAFPEVEPASIEAFVEFVLPQS